jgi:septal ring factor EnvC (AmiA/AmiB activator)
LNQHIKSLANAQKEIARIEQRLRELKLKSHQAQAELLQLNNSTSQEEQAHTELLEKHGRAEVSEAELDEADERLKHSRENADKKRPRLQAVANAHEQSRTAIISELLNSEMEARKAIAGYWDSERPKIVSEARKALPMLKLWAEVCSVDLDNELAATDLPEIPVPLDQSAIRSKEITQTERDSVRYSN